MKLNAIEMQQDLVIVGGGMPGICAAIQAARLGLSVALVQARGYLGGNASPEIRVTIEGGDGSGEFNFYARESGIMEELRLENKYRNPQGNVYLWHDVLLDAIYAEKNIALYLNTYVDEVDTDDEGCILAVEGSQSGCERRWRFIAPLFMDDTGDGTVGFLAGASYRMGREGKAEYGESIAPETEDNLTMLSTLSFYTKDTGRDAPFTLPQYAQNERVKDALHHREIPDRIPGHSRWEGYRMQWFYETGCGMHQVDDTEAINAQHRTLVNGIWNHIKHSDNYQSNTFDFEYVSPVPGKRESRRLVGDYIMTQHDIQNQPHFPDAIGHGGWSVDLHAMEGFFSTDLENKHYILKGVYEIPYRASYTSKVPNLWTIGRSLSVSHVALGTMRVMATLAVVGQAAACAAYLCKLHGTNAVGVYQHHLPALQQLIVKNDQYIPQIMRVDPADAMQSATVQASSQQRCEVIPTEKTPITGYPLAQETALVIPAQGQLEHVAVLLNASKDTTLQYRVSCPDKPQNYDPAVLLCEGAVAIAAQDEFAWVKLPIGKEIGCGKAFVSFAANPDCQLATVQDNLNGVLFLQHAPSPLGTYFDLQSNQPKAATWEQIFDVVPCFTTSAKTEIYASSNVANGMIRNDALPSIWLSEPSDIAPTLEATFAQVTEIGQATLVFDSSLHKRYYNFELIEAQNVYPSLVKAFVLLAKVDGTWQEVARVAENHQRICKVAFPPVAASALKLCVTETNGASRAAVYEIRAMI